MKKAIGILMLFVSGWCYAQSDTAFVRTFGGPSIDIARCVKQVHDGGFILAGVTSSFGPGASSVYLVRTDSNGVRKWSNTYGGINIDDAYGVKETLDKGFIVCGFTNSFGNGGYDVYLFKTDSSGNLKWQKTFGGTDWDFGYGVETLKDSGFVVCGESYSFTHGGSDAYLIRTDKNGDSLWTRHWGGNGDDAAYSIKAFRDTSYIIAGKVTSVGGDLDGFFARYGSHGNLMTSQSYGGSGDDYIKDVALTRGNNVLMIGSSNSPGGFGDFDYWNMQCDSMGNNQWTNIEGGTSADYGYAIGETRNGNLDVNGTSSSFVGLGGTSMLVLRLTQFGGWQITGAAFGGIADEQGYAIEMTSRGGVVYAGSTTSYGKGLEDMYFVKMYRDSIGSNYTLDSLFILDQLSPLSVQSRTFDQNGVSLYPNPFTESTRISILNKDFDANRYSFELFDLSGRAMIRKTELNTPDFYLSREGLEAGTYVYVLSDSAGMRFRGKVIVTK